MDQNHLVNAEIVDYWGFLKSIDWYEPWLIALILVHIGTITVTVCTRNYSVFQVILFVVLLLLVYFSETINGLGARYWKTFSREQYFDSNGLFISTVFSIPILLNCMLIISNWLYSSTVLMSKVKAAQLREQRKSRMSARMPAYNPEGNQFTEERQKRMTLLNSQWNSIYGPEATQLQEERKTRMTMLSNRLNNPDATESNTEPDTDNCKTSDEPSSTPNDEKTTSNSPTKLKNKSE